MGDMADFALDDRMSEWELAMDNEFANIHTKYRLGLIDEDGFEKYPGTPIVDNSLFKPVLKIKASGKGKCPICGNDTHLVHGKFGNFYGCNSFPKCKGNRNE